MVEVIGTDEFRAWYNGLTEKQQDQVIAHVDMLAEQGVALPFPYSSAIEGAQIALRELRIQAGGHPLRVFYVFDPARQAVLLVAGDKTGQSDKRFYAAMVPAAERIYTEYLKETDQTGKKG